MFPSKSPDRKHYLFKRRRKKRPAASNHRPECCLFVHKKFFVSAWFLETSRSKGQKLRKPSLREQLKSKMFYNLGSGSIPGAIHTPRAVLKSRQVRTHPLLASTRSGSLQLGYNPNSTQEPSRKVQSDIRDETCCRARKPKSKSRFVCNPWRKGFGCLRIMARKPHSPTLGQSRRPKRLVVQLQEEQKAAEREVNAQRSPVITSVSKNIRPSKSQVCQALPSRFTFGYISLIMLRKYSCIE